MAREIVARQSAKEAHFHAGAHATFIVDLACAIAFNTQERMLLVVETTALSRILTIPRWLKCLAWWALMAPSR